MELKVVLAITLSVLFFTIINLKSKFFSRELLIVAGFTVFISLAANKDNPDFSLVRILVAIPLCFTGGIAVFFRDEILPRITERSLHLLSLLHGYTVLVNVPVAQTPVMAMMLMAPVVVAHYYAISRRALPASEKIFAYCVQLYFLVCIGYYNLKRMVLYDMPPGVIVQVDVELFVRLFCISGMLFYILIYVLNLLLAVPLPAKCEPDYSRLFIEKMGDAQANPAVTLAITAMAAALFGLNLRYHAIPHSFITEFLVVCVVIGAPHVDAIAARIAGMRS